MTTPRKSAKEAIDEAAAEIRRETGAAAAEVRIELSAAGRETREALREAMAEVRAALYGTNRQGETPTGGGSGAATRLSRAERKELTRELLLDAAIEVFARKGYHGASLDDVAEAAGFTKGAVYSNFTRKADLFLALLERETRRRNAALAEAISAVPLELIPDLAAEWMERQSGEDPDWDVLTIEFWLAAVRDPVIRESLAEGDAEAMDRFGAILDEKVDAAGARPGLTGREIAVIVNALGTGMLMNRQLDPDGASADLFARAVRKLLSEAPPGDDRPEPDLS
jgi:AcrR family transcriptional regulator